MSDNNEITAVITTEEPAVAATLDELRYLVFEGKKGDTGDSAYEEAVALGFVGTEEEWIASLKGEKGDPGEDGVSFVHAYLDEGVVRYVYAYKEHETDDIYTSTAMAQDIENGILPLLHYSPEDDVFDYFELDRYDLSHASRVVYFRSKDYLLSVDSTGAYTLSDRPQGGDVANAVLYTPQTLTDAQQAQARKNIGAGTYSKPNGGIPDSDIASAATWNAKGTYSKPSGGIPKTDLASDVRTSLGKADTALQTAPVTSVNNKTGAVTLTASDVGALPSSTSIPTKVSDLTNDSGYQTAPFEIPITRSGSTYTTTVTAEEIREHADNCVIVYGNLTFDKTVVSVSGQTVSVNTAVVSLSADKTYAIYTTISVSVDASDAVTVAFRQKQENFLPVTTASDNGKFLRVVSGAWAAETIQTYQGGSY